MPAHPLDGDKGRTIVSLLIARAWKDPAARHQFLTHPKAALAGESIDLPADVHVKVLEDTPNVKYINLTHSVHLEENKERLVTLMGKLLPIPPGKELRFVQSSEKHLYLVLPRPPGSVATKQESELMITAHDSGVEATFHDTTQTTEVETTEVTVTETTEVQDAETTTTVVAEAELVAT